MLAAEISADRGKNLLWFQPEQVRIDDVAPPKVSRTHLAALFVVSFFVILA